MEKISKVISIMKRLDYPPKIDSFKDRLIIQKTVSILESMEMNLGYGFFIHLRGPYCRDLTEDVYSNKALVEGLKSNYPLNLQEDKKVIKFKEVTDLDPDYLEIISTYLHFKIIENKEDSDSILLLKALKPHLSDSKVAVGISKAKELLPLDAKQIANMKKEHEELDIGASTDLSKWD
ncbi:hypothetical protein HY989_05155 [Candidatus Micrarchaeota archaeon]|nr:hypothetical protein [Candidatus Micrarchaeota archaeon]